MPLTKDSLNAFIEVAAAVRTAMDHFDVPTEKSGVACARGTLTARINALRLVSAALEDRDANAGDRLAIAHAVNTFCWLRWDAQAVKDFHDVDLPVPPTPLASSAPDRVQSGVMTYPAAMDMTIALLAAVGTES